MEPVCFCPPLLLSSVSRVGVFSSLSSYIVFSAVLTTCDRTVLHRKHTTDVTSSSLLFQDFPLLRLDDVVGDQSNIVGFSMLNTSHSFYLEFIRSLNLSWREGCDISPYPGPAVRHGAEPESSLAFFKVLEVCFVDLKT